MTRRQFIRNFVITFKSLAMLSLMPKISFAVASADYGTETSHYKPLNGRSLRDIAKEQLQIGRAHV